MSQKLFKFFAKNKKKEMDKIFLIKVLFYVVFYKLFIGRKF